MNRNYELIKKIIANGKYKVIEDNGEQITIRYQMNAICFFPSDDEDGFVSIILSNFAEVTEKNLLDVIMRCHKLNEQVKQVKLYTYRDEILIAASEIFFWGEEDLAYQIKMSLDCLIATKVRYRRLEEIIK